MSRTGDTLRATCITLFGSGYAPFASGTWGSLTAVGLYGIAWAIVRRAGDGRMGLELVTIGGVLLASVLSVAFGRWAVAYFKSDDPKPFVLDEFAGQWTSLLFMPIALSADLWSVACVVGLQFLLFRLFDILKLPPAAQAEDLPHGWGVLLDDVVAGIFANVAGQVVWRLLPAAAWLGVTLG